VQKYAAYINKAYYKTISLMHFKNPKISGLGFLMYYFVMLGKAFYCETVLVSDLVFAQLLIKKISPNLLWIAQTTNK